VLSHVCLLRQPKSTLGPCPNFGEYLTVSKKTDRDFEFHHRFSGKHACVFKSRSVSKKTDRGFKFHHRFSGKHACVFKISIGFQKNRSGFRISPSVFKKHDRFPKNNGSEIGKDLQIYAHPRPPDSTEFQRAGWVFN
jgi:hypothetical protein